MKLPDRNDNLGFLLNTTANSLNVYMSRTLQANDIDVPFEQLKLLMYISMHEGTNQQIICSDLNKAKPGISRLVNNLVQKGMVQQVEDKEDRRNKKLYPTKKGLEIRDQFFPIGYNSLLEIEKDLGEKESKKLKAALRTVKEIILDKLNSNES